MRVYRHGVVPITDGPTLVCALPQDVSHVLVRNVGTVAVYLGGPDVCAPSKDEDEGPQGFPLKVDDAPMSVACVEYDVGSLFAVAAEGRSGKVAFLVAS